MGNKEASNMCGFAHSRFLYSSSAEIRLLCKPRHDDETPPYLHLLVLVRGKHIAIATVRAPVHSRAEELPSATMRTLPVC